MKKNILVIGLIFIVAFGLCGCGDNTQLKQERDDLTLQIEALKSEKNDLENEIVDEKVEKGTAIYVVTVNIKQSHLPWDVSENIKDSLNDIDIEIPVSEEFYNTVEVGTVLDDSFRMGSFVMNGSFGSWDITVKDKQIQ